MTTPEAREAAREIAKAIWARTQTTVLTDEDEKIIAEALSSWRPKEIVITDEDVEAAARLIDEHGCNWENGLMGYRKARAIQRARTALQSFVTRKLSEDSTK